MKIIGADISLEHGAFCILNEDGLQESYLYVTNDEKEYAVNPSSAAFLDVVRGKEESLESYRIRRTKSFLDIFQKHIMGYITAVVDEIYFSIEGYAYRASTNSIVQQGELNGQMKSMIYFDGGKIRIHDPSSLKLFATGKGNATKQEMLDQSLEEGFYCWAPCYKTKNTVKKKISGKIEKTVKHDIDGPKTDVIDAYFLARFLWYELQLRSGAKEMADLPEHKIRVFNKVSKSYPINVLARPFIQNVI